ncbi:MAG: sporulation protein YabP [Bacillota bacterium]|jgi:sporulation protein YabP|nr:sporulation protein YabP [Clostridia bacterium]
MPDQKVHYFSLDNREVFKLKGVTKVETFDDAEIVLETNAAPMVLKGENLHINNLNLEAGELTVIGLMKTIQYLEPQGYKSVKGKGKSILNRLLK